ncbi:MAG TPA: hypothetical protein ENN17_06385 [bacterium]|nr:hypothetical protein [bacterium]
MALHKYVVSALMLCIMISCASSRKTGYGTSRFVFEHEGKTYAIISYTPEDRMGHNLLISTDEKQSSLKARDLNQDGTLDTVIAGPLSLKEAKGIYRAGLMKAAQAGNLINRETRRQYQTEDAAYRYAITTYMPLIGDAYNVFEIADKRIFTMTVIAKDMLSDGSLETIEQGSADLKKLQTRYETILKKGVDEKRIQKQEESYFVKIQ